MTISSFFPMLNLKENVLHIFADILRKLSTQDAKRVYYGILVKYEDLSDCRDVHADLRYMHMI